MLRGNNTDGCVFGHNCEIMDYGKYTYLLEKWESKPSYEYTLVRGDKDLIDKIVHSFGTFAIKILRQTQPNIDLGVFIEALIMSVRSNNKHWDDDYRAKMMDLLKSKLGADYEISRKCLRYLEHSVRGAVIVIDDMESLRLGSIRYKGTIPLNQPAVVIAGNNKKDLKVIYSGDYSVLIDNVLTLSKRKYKQYYVKAGTSEEWTTLITAAGSEIMPLISKRLSYFTPVMLADIFYNKIINGDSNEAALKFCLKEHITQKVSNDYSYYLKEVISLTTVVSRRNIKAEDLLGGIFNIPGSKRGDTIKDITTKMYTGTTQSGIELAAILSEKMAMITSGGILDIAELVKLQEEIKNILNSLTKLNTAAKLSIKPYLPKNEDYDA